MRSSTLRCWTFACPFYDGFGGRGVGLGGVEWTRADQERTDGHSEIAKEVQIEGKGKRFKLSGVRDDIIWIDTADDTY